ncbi:pyruvate ferredoxin oxidoreductase [bacterium]|nr:pyruvate ferredoxin oxidoreductase [bacterium]
MPALHNHHGEKTLKELITGNEAVSTAVRLARVQVIAAYPITPQTSVAEKLSLYCAEGMLDADFIKVESEHSAMACVIGAASTGVRTFTATSSQGLALMHEMLHWASGARLPIVMANVNRALGAPWSIWCDHSDSMAQRDTGWLQFFCESCQEVLDTVLMSFRLAEKVATPVMVLLDGFILSHTAEPVDVPEPEAVDRFLPPWDPPLVVDPSQPHTFNAVTSPEYFMEFKQQQAEGASAAEAVAREVSAEFAREFGRNWPLTEAFMVEDAETVLVAAGTSAGTCRHVVRRLREQGRKVGLVRMRMFRPFPYADLRAMLGGAKNVAVLDQSVSPGTDSPLCQEVKSALYGLDSGKAGPRVFGFVAGLGGRDIVPENIERMLDVAEGEHPPVPGRLNWLGLNH